VRAHGRYQYVALRGCHDPAFHVLIEREDRHGLFPDSEGRCGNDGGKLTSEATAIERKLTFQNGATAGNFLAMETSYGFDDGLGLGSSHRANARHGFTQPLEPQPAIGIEHDLNGAGVIEVSQ